MKLTERQAKIADFMALGQSSKRIARQLGISHKTVETHRARIMRKAKVKNVAEFVRFWIGRQLCGECAAKLANSQIPAHNHAR